jgi:hypothetical protein
MLQHSLLTLFASPAYSTQLQLVGGTALKPPLFILRYKHYIFPSHSQTHTLSTSKYTGIYYSVRNTSEYTMFLVFLSLSSSSHITLILFLEVTP